MPATDKQIIGRLGEELAADFLIKEGYTIVERNKHLGKNEIDIIAEDKDFFVFVEVKTRTCLYPESGEFGIPSRAVDISKRKNTVKASRDYLYSHYTEKQPRIDVIEVYLLEQKDQMLTPKPIKINHIRNAFDARGRKLH
ncbi:MAG: YraN family protein [Ruminococcaceae bacterium]|nr:YraN family protein [Oscillospiraceae bacterium]